MALITTPGFERSLAAEGSGSTTTSPKRPAMAPDLLHPDEAIDPSGNTPLCAGDWTAHAMCKGKTALFFAPPGERDGRRRRREALATAYCAVCPVRDICASAGRQGREHGIWGGENDEERALAGHAPRSPHRRAIAEAARTARERMAAEAAQSAASPEANS